ncbi:MAG: hypothetical protein IPG67_11265 [Acidobacteria bacterium]|nr:hypothetical protein [Acidobacteriota bacterium]
MQETTVTYTGTGSFSASVNAVVRTVNAGDSASYTVTFTSLNDFAGNIYPQALDWGGVPNSSAHWSPNPVYLPSNGAASTTFTISTSSNTPANNYGNIRLQGRNGSVIKRHPRSG